MALATGIFLDLTIIGIVVLNMLYLFIEPFENWLVRQVIELQIIALKTIMKPQIEVDY